MKHLIDIENTQMQKRPFRGYKSLLRTAIAMTLSRVGFDRKAMVSVTLVSTEEIRRLNREYRGIDRETDVLSFPILEEEGVETGDTLGSAVLLGDILIAPRVIAEQASSFDNTYEREFCLMVIHSTLHLLGWDHIDEDEKKEMFQLQEDLLARMDPYFKKKDNESCKI